MNDFAKDKVNILLVDDQDQGLLALEAILQPLEQNLVLAKSGEEALRHVLSTEFALILMDVQMPIMDGLETASFIREREFSRNTPIIFITASNKSEHHIFKGYSVGAVDYVFKPVDPEILRSKVSVFTELARISSLLKRQAKDLETREKEARDLAELRNDLLGEIEYKNRELEAFSYAVAHDLKAPLRSIEGFSQMLQEEYGEKFDEQGKDYLQRVLSASKYMGSLIDDLLNLSRMTRGELNCSEVDLSKQARKILEQIGATDPERQLNVTIADQLIVYCDARLFEAVMTNLISNAWKFTRKTLNPKIEVGVTKMNGERVYFISDNGAGFDMAYSKKLFLPFQRLHTSSEFEGNGIGLATAQRIIQRHKGRIWARAEVDHGATFFFTLPDSREKKEIDPSSLSRGLSVKN
ncbi:MAG: response regulator [Deltaproteobacteria bacterium]|nr:response regulator [Deltaproteobacteria bacterium]